MKIIIIYYIILYYIILYYIILYYIASKELVKDFWSMDFMNWDNYFVSYPKDLRLEINIVQL